MENKTALQGEPRLAQRLQLAEAGAPAGGAARIEDQHRRGKPMARERIELLLDEGSFESGCLYR